MYTPVTVRPTRLLSIAVLALVALSVANPRPTLSQIKQSLQKADHYRGATGKSYLRVETIDKKGLATQSYAGDAKAHHTEDVAFEWSNVASITIEKNSAANVTSVVIHLKQMVNVQLNTLMDGEDRHQVGLDDKVAFDFQKRADALLLKSQLESFLKQSKS